MSLHLVILYLRSRLAGWGALGLIAIVGAFSGFGIMQSATGTADTFMLAKVVVPLMLTVVIVTTTRSPFGEAERTASRSLSLLRGSQLAAIALLAVGGLALAAGTWHSQGEDTRLLLIRNLFGLLGIGLLTALVLGASMAWLIPMLAGFLAIFSAPNELASASFDVLWTWPSRAINDRAALAIVVAVMLVGVLAHARYGARDTLDESH